MTESLFPGAQNVALPVGIGVSAGTVEMDVACRRCGYNLRGLLVQSRCPECGTPVGLSVQGDLLRFSDPDWLRKLARGISLILWGMAIMLLATMAATVAAAFLGPVVIHAATFFAGLVSWSGAWLVTERDPSLVGEDRYGKVRRFIRVTLILGVGSGLLNLVLSALGWDPQTIRSTQVFSGVLGLVGLAGEYAKLTYFEKMALRIPDRELARKAANIRIAYVILGSLMILLGVCAAIFVASAPTMAGTRPGVPPRAPLPGGAAFTPLLCLLPIVGLVWLVYLLLYLRLQYRLGKAFRAQAALASATWAQAPSPVPGPK